MLAYYLHDIVTEKPLTSSKDQSQPASSLFACHQYKICECALLNPHIEEWNAAYQPAPPLDDQYFGERPLFRVRISVRAGRAAETSNDSNDKEELSPSTSERIPLIGR